MSLRALSLSGLRLLWRLLVLSLLLLCLLLSLAYALFTRLPEHREELEVWGSALLQREISIGSVQTYWENSDPVVELNRVELGRGDGGEGFSLHQIKVSLNPILSLLSASLRTENIRLSSHQVRLRYAAGRVTLVGLTDTDETEAAPLPLDRLGWLLRQAHLTLVAEQLVWTDSRQHAHHFSGARLEFYREGGAVYALKAHLRLPRQRLDLGEGIYLQGGELGLDARSEWLDGRLLHMRGRLSGLNLKAASLEHRVNFQRFSGQFNFTYLHDGWDLALDQVQLYTAQQHWPRNRFNLRSRWRDGVPEFEAELGYAQVEELLPLLGSVSGLDPALRQALLQTRPAAQLQNLKFAYAAGAWQLHGEFRHWRQRAWQEWPGLRNWSGSFSAAEDGGSLRLETYNADLELPTLYGQAFALPEVRGELIWARHPDAAGWRVRIPLLETRSAGINRASLRGSLDWPDHGPPLADLQLSLADAALGDVHRYVPDRAVDAEVMQWLRQGLRAGNIVRAEGVLRGPLDALPFDHGEGLLQLRGEVVGAGIDYAPEWPPLSRVDAEVVLRGRGLSIDANQGRVVGVRLGRTHAEIPDYTADSPVLQVKGRARGAGANGLRFIAESPLRRDLGLDLSGLSLQGNIDLDLSLRIPLDQQPGTARGRIRFDANQARDAHLGLEVTALQGSLAFDDQVLRSEGLNGRLFGAPVELALSNSGVAQAPTLLTLTGHATPAFLHALAVHLHPEAEFAGLRDSLHGSAAWRARIEFPALASADLRLDIESDLSGLNLDLPAPFGKSAAAVVPLTVRLDLPPRQAPRRVELRYGNEVSGRWRRDPGQPLRSQVHFGPPPAEWPEDSAQLRVRGRIQRLSVSAWHELWQRLYPRQSDSGGLSGSARVDLTIDQFEVAGQHFNHLALQGESQDNYWGFEFEAQEVKGVGHFNPRQRQLELGLDRLVLRHNPSPAASLPGPALHPRQFPSLRLRCDALSVDNYDLGRLEWRSDSDAAGLHLRELSLDTGNTRLQVRGDWLETSPQTHYTQINSRLDSDNFGAFLSRFGIADSEVEGGKTQIEFQLYWPGGPDQFSLPKATGYLSLLSKKGYLVRVEPGLGRVFGLLGLFAMPHRLLGDINQALGKGFGFTQIQGDFSLAGGYAYSDNLHIEGPAAQIRIRGRTDLVAQIYDQSLDIVPHTAGSLPLAGALVGGLPLGALALVVQQVLRDRIDQATHLRYRLSGTWRDPVLEPVPD